MPRERAKAVIFDFDDTLEDFKTTKAKVHAVLGRYFERAYGIKAARIGRLLEAIDYHYTLLGKGGNPSLYDRHLWLADCFRKLGLKPKKAELGRLVRLYWATATKEAKLYPGIMALLRSLKARSLKLALISDSDGRKAIKLARVRKLGLLPLFDVFVTGDDTRINKPDRKFYELVLSALRLPARACVMVGDKPEVDLALAKALGMTTVWMIRGLWAEKRAKRKFGYVDHRVRSVAELRRVLAKLT